jgi:hypothetical protein
MDELPASQLTFYLESVGFTSKRKRVCRARRGDLPASPTCRRSRCLSGENHAKAQRVWPLPPATATLVPGGSVYRNACLS